MNKNPCASGSRILVLLAAGFLPLGCRSVTELSGALAGKLGRAAEPVVHSWERATKTDPPPNRAAWAWVSGIPTGAPRAELVESSLSGSAVAQFVPQLRRGDVMLASTQPVPQNYRIKNIGGRRIRNCADLHLALNQSRRDAVQVDLAPTSGTELETAVCLEPRDLLALSHCIAEDQRVMRIAEDGNPWFLIRDGGIRGKLMVRADRRHGLLQVVLSVANCWGGPALIPKEVRAGCDGQPLRCVSVAQTLELLYGETDREDTNGKDPERGPVSNSFAEASEADDFLMPTNYNSLRNRLALSEGSSTKPRRPALACLPGTSYPGPALLGDARALSGFLLQRQWIQTGDPETTGWVLFAGEPLNEGRVVDVAVDLGSGMQSHRFELPQP